MRPVALIERLVHRSEIFWIDGQRHGGRLIYRVHPLKRSCRPQRASTSSDAAEDVARLALCV